MAAEAWVLDSLPLTSGTFALLELNADPPRQRAEWITGADVEGSVLLRQPEHEQRVITMKLRVQPQASMDTAFDAVAALVTKLRAASATPAGIALVWTPANSARSRTFDVLAGEVTGLPIDVTGQGRSWLLQRPIIDVSFTCKPYWRGDEVTTSTASTSTPFVTLAVSSVPGDIPALGRIIVTDTASQSRRHVEWGLEGPDTYNASTSLLVDSDDMVTSGFAGAQATTSGMYDPNASGNNSVSATLYSTPIAICGLGDLSHVGLFRVKARVLATVGPAGTSGCYLRLAWRAGDDPYSANEWTTDAVPGYLEEIDLGLISIRAVASGTQRWNGRIEGYTTVAGSVIKIDYLILVPVTDGYGVARATYVYRAGVVVGQDSFTSTTATSALNTRVAPSGGTWATSGSTTDFAFADDLSDEQIKRSTSADAGPRWAVLGSTAYTDMQVDVLLQRTGFNLTSTLEQGLIARWVDSSNYLRVVAVRDSAGTRTFSIIKRIAGVDTTLATTTLPTTAWISSTYSAVRLIVFASGRAIAQMTDATGVTAMAALDTSDSTLASGGTLDDGKPGIYDFNGGSNSVTRYYDNFIVSTPAAEPIVLYSGRTLEVRSDKVIRQDSTGVYTGQPQSYEGTYARIPVGTSRLLVKARRNDIQVAADDQVTDATQIQVAYTPRGLVVPRS